MNTQAQTTFRIKQIDDYTWQGIVVDVNGDSYVCTYTITPTEEDVRVAWYHNRNRFTRV